MSDLDPGQLAREMAGTLSKDRRHLHRHPDLSGAEGPTAQFIASRLSETGWSPRLLMEGRAVVAELEGGAGPGRRLLIRADIDALPIQERGPERPYRSEVPGVMHACGHDAHVAIALGVAEGLMRLRAQLHGAVRLAFQPAEETAGGAEEMIREGVMDDPPVEGALGLHIWSGVPAGTVGVRDGAIFASADGFSLVVRGRGGHGALPHQALDPVPITSLVVLALQTLVSRETSPFESAVVTVGQIQGGQAFNVIPEEVRLSGTVRAFSAETRLRLLRRIEETSAGIAASFGASAETVVGAGCPPVVSDPRMAALVRAAVAASPGVGLVEPDPITVGDDVALFLELVPGCYFLLGGGNREVGIVAPHHHPEFDLDEACLPVGVEVMLRAALAYCAGEG